MLARWEHTEETDNAGKPFDVWRSGDYELSRNWNRGHEGGWVFELTYQGERVAHRSNLSEGKRAAAEHEAEKSAPRGGPGDDAQAAPP